MSVMIVSLPYVALYFKAMATTSLWNDEIFTILNHSSHGPLAVLTDYSSNSHLLFNLLNSAFPGRDSLDPLRARSVSFLAFAAMLALSTGFVVRRGSWLAGSLVFAALALNREILDLFLQARGYGLAGLFSIVVTASFVAAFEKPSSKSLLTFSAASVLGCASLPTFGFWMAPLWVLLLQRHREAGVVIAAAGGAAGVVVFHSGILSQMLALQMGGYADRWGAQYASVASVFDTLRLYVLGSLGSRSDWAIALALLAGVGILVTRREGGRALSGPEAVLLSVGAFFVICLALRTPLVRTTSFVAVPVLAASGLVFGPLVLPEGSMRWRRFAPVLLVLLVLPYSVMKFQRFEFVPIENWKETASWIRLIFPEGVRAHATVAGPYLWGYLERERIEDGFDPENFLRGNLVVADTPMLESERQPVPGEGQASVAALKVIQRRNNYQRILFSVPERSHLLVPPGLRDRDASTCAAEGRQNLRFDMDKGLRYRSLALTHSPQVFPAKVSVIGPAGPVPLTWELHQDGLSLYGLGDQELESVMLQMPPGSCLAEVWAYPAVLSKTLP